ncbi:MAG TPA: DUF6049 family protein [Acidimicrobiales bacterium]|nr:DUF6049 family protein [Acidimicrobiales bacterium]
MRWARTALSTFAVTALALLGTWSAGAPGAAAPVAAPAAGPTAGPPLTLVSQTPWVSAQLPWFNLAFKINPSAGPAADLHVSLTFYDRINDFSQLQQAVTSASPPTSAEGRPSDFAVTSAGPDTLTAAACVTVVPESSTTVPAGGPGACPAGDPTLVLGCTPMTGRCGDVYPVSVALERQGSSAPLARFTTFLTYQEPQAVGAGGALRVALVVPVSGGGFETTADALAEHRELPTTLAVNPDTVNTIEETHDRAGTRALAQLGTLAADEVVDQSYVPVNLAALSEAGLPGEIGAQVTRGGEVLRATGFKPTEGTWVDPSTSFSQGDAGNLAGGLKAAGALQLVLNDTDLAAGGDLADYTFAQPFSLDLGGGTTIESAAVNSTLSARFSANQANPVLSAEQLLAGLSFVHFENAYLSDHRGIVIAPPAGWQPSGAFLDALMSGLTGNQALSPVTLAQFFDQVPAGGGPNDREPTVRHLQSGDATHGITHNAADRIGVARQELGSYADAVKPAHPPELTTLSDSLLTTESRTLSAKGRAAALGAYDKQFAGVTDAITLGTEQTVTFTAQRAAIPVTVLSSAPYPVTVVVTLASDKFTFPDGNTRQLVLDRPTTSVRVTAQARTSGDRLPIEVTLQTPDGPSGQLTLARTVLTVHSTAISFVGVALTVLAGAVLLVWWLRTWRRSRRQRLRAHP